LAAVVIVMVLWFAVPVPSASKVCAKPAGSVAVSTRTM
jgi:hypothetical protein